MLKMCSECLLRARNIFTHVNSIKRSIMGNATATAGVLRAAWGVANGICLAYFKGRQRGTFTPTPTPTHTHSDNKLAVYYSQC